MKWKLGHWRYRLIELAAIALIMAPLGRLAWWQLACIVLGLVVIEATAIAQTVRDYEIVARRKEWTALCECVNGLCTDDARCNGQECRIARGLMKPAVTK